MGHTLGVGQRVAARRALFIKNASPTSPRHKREADFEAQLEESIATRKGSALELLEKEKQKKAAKKAQVSPISS